MKREIIRVELSRKLEGADIGCDPRVRTGRGRSAGTLLSVGAELPGNSPQKHRPRCLRSEWLQLLPDGSQLYGRALQGLV
jgi:hypothetical protein